METETHSSGINLDLRTLKRHQLNQAYQSHRGTLPGSAKKSTTGYMARRYRAGTQCHSWEVTTIASWGRQRQFPQQRLHLKGTSPPVTVQLQTLEGHC